MHRHPLTPLLLPVLVVAAACSDADDRVQPVGRITRHYVDSSRTDWDGRVGRPLVTRVWYPARAGSGESAWAAGVFRFGRSALDAPFADDARRPLIVLSHGTGGSAAQLSWLAEALATEGFIVAGVDHHGNTATEATYRLGGFVLPGERARDLSVLVDLLLADSLLGARIDASSIGAAGFSLGGFSVLALAGAHLPPDAWQRRCAVEPDVPWCVLPPEAPFTLGDIDSLQRSDAAFQAAASRGLELTRDPRITALFAIAPALLPVTDTLSLRTISVPVHVLLGDSDEQVPYEITAGVVSAQLRSAQISRLQGVSHYAFLAECTLRGRILVRALCASDGFDRGEVHVRAAREALTFFRTHLRRAD
ncbi:MAG: hypothetical protein U5K74_12275 [Gemmatimonadaceae bacterium]|nr:hypothetical protein [Gemmatimonadaceae bacterium]